MLSDHVRVARRFQRAIRVDVDIGNPESLEGFICSQSVAEVLKTMAQHILENKQGAFTWTGAYGSGKSSLVVTLSALLGGDGKSRDRARAIVGKRTANHIYKALPPGKKGWRILPVVGRQERPEQVIGEAINDSGFLSGRKPRTWKEKKVLDALKKISALSPRSSGGLILFVDEMGKFLEAAAGKGSDIYLFQQVAELASRSQGQLIFVGVLHQSFGEYAHRLSREMRDEWTKIQGRFVDLSVSVSGSEQIVLIGSTIESDGGYRPKTFDALTKNVAEQIQKHTPLRLAEMLEECWPLHPVTACLLGPVSQRRFGQSQRSIFGFLNSAEPRGFQDFLREAEAGDLYGPDALWDYLRLNLGPSILASPDGHRWALAIDALDRCEAKEHKELHLQLLKTIALVDMLKGGSGLVASSQLLVLALQPHSIAKIKRALKDLQGWSLIIFRKFSNSYAIFEGSDFDIDQAIEEVSGDVGEIDFSSIEAFAKLQPVVAKRHYHETGALRWFDVIATTLSNLDEMVKSYEPPHGAIGAFFLAIPAKSESLAIRDQICQRAVSQNKKWEIVVGTSGRAPNLFVLARELLALEKVRDEMPELLGDRVARAEIYARIEALHGQFEVELTKVFASAQWHCGRPTFKLPKSLSYTDLNGFASKLASERFKKAPKIHNELLGRVKPSSSAVAGLNALLRRMALHEGKARLGITGFPAESGLFASLLERTRLYRNTRGRGWRFMPPGSGVKADPHHLAPAWKMAEKYLEDHKTETVPASEIYRIWREPPFGIKEGLLPVFLVAFFLSHRDKLAFYREGVFQAQVTDLDMDSLTTNPEDIRLRWMDLSGISRQLLSGMADIVRDLDNDNELPNLEPIDVARGLVAIYDQLPEWVGRTQNLSKNAQKVRQLFKSAKDPNKLIFDDIPRIFGANRQIGNKKTLITIEKQIREGLTELRQAYPAMLGRLRELLLTELQVANSSSAMLEELRARAENVKGLAGDHRLEAFVIRVAGFTGSDMDMESFAGMAINKPAQDWVDVDIDRASVCLAEMAQQFVRIEAFARVKGREDKRHALAIVTGLPGESGTRHQEFEIANTDRDKVELLFERLESVLRDSGEDQRHIILATLTELSARYLKMLPSEPHLQKQEKQV